MVPISLVYILLGLFQGRIHTTGEFVHLVSVSYNQLLKADCPRRLPNTLCRRSCAFAGSLLPWPLTTTVARSWSVLISYDRYETSHLFQKVRSFRGNCAYFYHDYV